MSFYFSRGIHTSGKYGTSEPGVLKAFDPAAQSCDGALGSLGVLLGGRTQEIDVPEMIISGVQRIGTVSWPLIS